MSAGLAVVLALLQVPGAGARAATLPDGVRAAADGIRAEQLARDLAHLSSDALLGRNTPSPGFDSAAAYIARRLEAAGLQPLGDDGGYFQHYDLLDARMDTAAARLEVGGRSFRFGDGFVMNSFAGPVDGTYPVVYVGHGWTKPGEAVDPYAGVDVRGKLLLVHGPGTHPRNVEIQRLGRITPGAASPLEEAARRGAVGVLYIADQEALDGWERSRARNVTRLELEPPVPSAYAAAPITSMLLQTGVAAALFDGEAVSGEEVRRRGDAGDYPASFQLGRTVAIRVPTASSRIRRPKNVVAVIEGSDPVLRNEYVTIASHLDGAVGRSALNGDSIYNAADDNASGSAATLSIAEQMMRAPRPKRSVVFIWDSGEERGLWGTRHFVHARPVPLDQIVAHFNIDMIGTSRDPDVADAAQGTGPNEVFLTGPRILSSQVDAVLEAVNRGYLGMELNRSRDVPESSLFYPRTDAGPFIERGVMTIQFATGSHERYHRPDDEARFLDPQKMEKVARTIFASLWTLADMEERPRIDREIPATVPRYR